MFIESTEASNHVEDGSEAHLVLDAVAVKSVGNRKLIGSYDWAAVGVVVLDPFTAVEALNLSVD